MKSKEIVGFENYIIYEDGRVFSKKSNKFLKPRKRGSRRPYMVVVLYDSSNSINATVHRLVAEAFIPNPGFKPLVNHKDNNQFNNHVDNLEWATYSENTQHSYNETDRGRAFRKVVQINKKSGEIIEEFESLKQAQEETGINYTNISKVCNGVGKSAGGYIWRYKEED
jgi:hypothetical protein